MTNGEYLKNITPANSRTLHEYSNHTLSDSAVNSAHSENEFNNLVYNSNLEHTNIIK